MRLLKRLFSKSKFCKRCHGKVTTSRYISYAGRCDIHGDLSSKDIVKL